MAYNSIILGIDPGTIVMGYGIVGVTGNKLTLIDTGVIKPGVHKNIYKRLFIIHNTVSGLIKKYKPTVFAIEAPFFGKNIQSMLKLGRAQGVAIASAMEAGLDVTEYSPKTVKQAITGNGNASKEQIFKMLELTFGTKIQAEFFDATDALGVAVCHYHVSNKLTELTTVKKVSGKKVSTKANWADFVAKNPNRIVK
jgi:crossover junction endodeoxyribonuclease RuvC